MKHLLIVYHTQTGNTQRMAEAAYAGSQDDEVTGVEARKLFTDAEQMLDKWIATGKVNANAVFGLLPANSVDCDDIEIYRNESRDETAARVVGLRQQTPHPGDRANLSLADFIAPRDSGVSDYIRRLSCR